MILAQGKLIGLDINTTHIRWVEVIKTTSQTKQIRRYGSIKLELKENIQTQLKSTLTSHSLAKSDISIALCDTQAKKTTLSLEANLSALQCRKAFQRAAMALYDQPANSLYYHAHLLGFMENQGSQLNFLLIVTPKSTLKERLGLFKGCQVTPTVIDLESFAIERGQKLLSSSSLSFENSLDRNFNSIDYTLSLGLAMHPNL